MRQRRDSDVKVLVEGVKNLRFFEVVLLCCDVVVFVVMTITEFTLAC